MVLVGVSMCPGDLTSASILAAITRPQDHHDGFEWSTIRYVALWEPCHLYLLLYTYLFIYIYTHEYFMVYKYI